MTVVALLVFSTLMCEGASTPPRRIPKGALTPEFSAVDTTGEPFNCTRSSGKVLILAFLSSQQKNSQEAVEDIFEALSSGSSRPLKFPMTSTQTMPQAFVP